MPHGLMPSGRSTLALYHLCLKIKAAPASAAGDAGISQQTGKKLRCEYGMTPVRIDEHTRTYCTFQGAPLGDTA